MANSNHTFFRVTTGIIDTATAMQAQVQALGGINAALRQGHGATLYAQLVEMMSMCRTLERTIKDKTPDGSYSIVHESNETAVTEPSFPSPNGKGQ